MLARSTVRSRLSGTEAAASCDADEENAPAEVGLHGIIHYLSEPVRAEQGVRQCGSRLRAGGCRRGSAVPLRRCGRFMHQRQLTGRSISLTPS
ncbi:hypothetical protein C7S15_6673 [Burkholderia cepacia]|nr:hypothetical protein [Burkholderia cepacia]